MTTRRNTRSFPRGTTDVLPKTGSDGPQVVAVSGEPSGNTERLPRDSSAVSAQPPGLPPGHREPIEIDAASGQRLGDLTEHAAARAARYRSAREAAGRASTAPLDRVYLDHVFGSNLPGR
jgi:hypothetical protein